MASRVRGFGQRPEPSKSDVEPEVVAEASGPAFVDKGMLDEAVESTLDTADPRHAAAMRRLWASDPSSDAARAFFADTVRKQYHSRFGELFKKQHVVNETLTAAESAKVAEYAREFELTFRNSVGNEHAFFSARRGIDHEILLSKFPSSMRYLDFGGSVRYHVSGGNDRAVVVSPFDLDAKDPTRATLTRLALRKIAADGTRSAVVRNMAQSVLNGDGVYHRNETVQNTTASAPISLAVHVHDVPIWDWPKMMERCGVRVHEGCLHFSNDFFESDEGELEFSGAYYEIDRSRDIFRMRVGKSSTMWYTHKWSEYMLYGANQVLQTGDARYSYQITERRQDTLFYRILRVDGTVDPDVDQVYALPSVPMVEVDGFEVMSGEKRAGYASRRAFVRRKYVFPKRLWERMLTYATAELDRGGLSYDKMYNYYRTAVPRQSINSVYVSGGEKVPLQEVSALIVMSGVVAYSQSIMLQRSIKAHTDQIQTDRKLFDESTFYKGFRLFIDGLVSALLLPFSPFSSVSAGVGKIYYSLMREKLVSWAPRARIRSLNVALFVDHKSLSYSVRMPEQIDYATHVWKDDLNRVVDVSRVDADVARDILRTCGDALGFKVKSNLESVIGDTTVVGDGSQPDKCSSKSVDSDVAGVSWFMRDGNKKVRRTKMPHLPDSTVVSDRRLAVEEALKECLADTEAITDTCRRIFREVVVAGKPDEDVMRRRSEELYNPDIWMVNNGVLSGSVMNPSSDGFGKFTYGGVYLPIPDESGSYLFPVTDRKYSGPDSLTGRQVEREHFILPHRYTGFALVIDSLKIFNGPAISNTLARALEMPDERFLFTIVCHQGPPGCGKTTTVVKQGDPQTDLFMAPTRIAKDGIQQRLQADRKVLPERAKLVSRTLDSLLVNYLSLMNSVGYGFLRIKADEYVLARAGKWIAAAVLVGVDELHAYGDSKQITHKPRVQVPKFYLELVPQVLEEEFLTHRNPAEIVAGYNFIYNNEVRTTSTIVGSIVRVRNFSEVQWMSDVRLLSMHQADKKVLQVASARYAGGKPVVSTTHEAQGSDCDQIVLYNSEFRKRSAEDSFYLYGLLDYCLVAISRARKSVVYVKMSDEPDMITRMLEYSKDARRVSAAKDVSTQGTNNLGYL